jgi:hypothetical protein
LFIYPDRPALGHHGETFAYNFNGEGVERCTISLVFLANREDFAMMAITNVEQANADADVVPNHPLDPDPQVIAPASSTVRLYRVMCFHDGLWDNAEPQVVGAHNARAAAEKVCGRPLAQGVDKQSTLYVKVWPVIPQVEWFRVPAEPNPESEA